MHIAILYINLIVSIASASAAVIAVRRPSLLSGSGLVGNGELFYVRMYAARAIPFGLTAGILPFWSTEPAIRWVVFAAALVQFTDTAIGIGKRDKSMILGASLGALVHLICGLSLR